MILGLFVLLLRGLGGHVTLATNTPTPHPDPRLEGVQGGANFRLGNLHDVGLKETTTGTRLVIYINHHNYLTHAPALES